MIRIAVVEDEAVHVDRLIACLRRYGKEYNVAFSAARFSDAVSFLETYRGGFELIFLDTFTPSIVATVSQRYLTMLPAANVPLPPINAPPS